MLLPQSEVPVLPDSLKWEVVPVDPGQSYIGWTVGPVQIIGTHWCGDASRACRWRMSAGALACKCQTEGGKVRVIGYQPMVDKYNKRCVVILSATVAEEAKKLPHASAVKFYRPTKSNRPLQLTRILDDELPSAMTEAIRRRKPSDIGEYLLHLWQDRELTELLGCRYHPSAAVLNKAPSKSDAA